MISFDDLPLALLVVDRNHNIISANAKIFDIFGYQKEELVGLSVHVLVPPESREKHIQQSEDYYNNPVAKPLGVGRKLTGLKKDGSLVPVEISLMPFKHNGDFSVIVSIVDVSIELTQNINSVIKAIK